MQGTEDNSVQSRSRGPPPSSQLPEPPQPEEPSDDGKVSFGEDGGRLWRQMAAQGQSREEVVRSQVFSLARLLLANVYDLRQKGAIDEETQASLKNLVVGMDKQVLRMALQYQEDGDVQVLRDGLVMIGRHMVA